MPAIIGFVALSTVLAVTSVWGILERYVLKNKKKPRCKRKVKDE